MFSGLLRQMPAAGGSLPGSISLVRSLCQGAIDFPKPLRRSMISITQRPSKSFTDGILRDKAILVRQDRNYNLSFVFAVYPRI